MLFYQIATLFVLTILPFFPVQIDVRIPYIIGIFAFLLLPIFVKNLKEDLAKKNPITLFFILLLIACTISTIFSIYQQRSIVQLIVFASSFVAFISIRSIFPTIKSKELLVTCYLLLVTCLSLISLYNTLFRHFVNFEAKGVSFMWIYYGHNHLSALLLFAIPIAFFFLKKYWNTKSFGPLLLITNYLLLFSLFLTFGIGSVISFLFSVLITITLFAKISFLKKILYGLVTLFLLVFAIVGMLFLADAFKGESRFQKNTISSVRTHFSYMQDAVDTALKKPLTGSGLDTFIIINSESQRISRKTHYAHNFFFQMLSDAGIFGFLASVGLVVSLLWRVGKQLASRSQRLTTNDQRLFHIALFVALLASTINTLVDFDWQLPYVFLLFWTLAGIAIA